MLKKISLLLMLALALVACGKNNNTSATNTTEPTDGAQETTEPTTDGGDADEFCNLGASVFAEGNPFQGFDPSSPEGLREGFGAAVDLFEQLLAVAPAEVAVTIEDGVAAMVEMRATLEAVDYDFTQLTPEDGQRFGELAQKFDFTAFAAAAEAACS